MKRSKLASRLLRVRSGAKLIDDVPEAVRPANLHAAYAIADEIVAALQPSLGAVVGYKVGATSEAGQAILGLEEPFYGRAFAKRVLMSGSRWYGAGLAHSIEAEVGFVIGTDLPARSNAYSSSEVRRAVARVVPLLEINRPSYARPFEMGGFGLIADNGVTQAFVRGRRGTVMGRRSFRHESVQLLQNGCEVALGSAEVVMGDPLRSLIWLANALSRQGRGLIRGDVVASGAMTPPIHVDEGDSIVARYSTLGSIAVTIGPGG